jgi:hypothetical protein
LTELSKSTQTGQFGNGLIIVVHHADAFNVVHAVEVHGRQTHLLDLVSRLRAFDPSENPVASQLFSHAGAASPRARM